MYLGGIIFTELFIKFVYIIINEFIIFILFILGKNKLNLGYIYHVIKFFFIFINLCNIIYIISKIIGQYIIFIIIIIFKPVNVGKINKEGKAEYIERVANVTKYPDKKIVEFKTQFSGKDMQDYIAMVMIWYATQTSAETNPALEKEMTDALLKIEQQLDKVK